jgi:hypothetical protein
MADQRPLGLTSCSWLEHHEPPNLRRSRRSAIHHGPTTLGEVNTVSDVELFN